MKNHKNTLIQISLVLLSFALLFAPSCKQIIGLGPQVDMTGPTVNVQTPVDMQVVTGADFIISGTVIDDSEVAELTIDIPDLALFWKHTKDGWFSKTASSSWQPLTDGVTWNKDEKGLITWSLTTTLSTEHQLGSTKTEFIVTVSAKDNSNNSSSKSVQQRTIVYDNIIPGFTLNKPTLKKGDVGKAEIEGYKLEDIAIISSLLNGDLNLQWNIKEDSQIHKLKIALYDVSKTEDEKEVFSEEFEATETEQILRSDSLTVAADNFPNEGKQIIEVRVRVVDAGGNVLGKEDATDELLSLGYFCYWPEADIPWLALPMEKHSKEQDEPNYNFPVSPTQTIQGQAYDDDGVKSVSVKIYKENLNEPVLEETIPKIPANENLGKTYHWSVSAPEEAGNYRIEVSCTDINNTESAPAIGYFNVADIGAPSITIAKIDGKSFEESPLLDLMDEYGKFTLSGTAEDDSGIEKVQIAWFKNLEDKPKYLNGENEVWNEESPANAKIWTSESGSNTKKFEFSQDINIFSDLGVDGSSLLFGNFNFVIRAEDISGKTKCISLTTNGDREPPLLTIDSLNLSGTTYYLTEKGKTVGANEIPENGLPPLKSSDTISFSGTWKDNSTTKWNDKSKIGSIVLKCNDDSFEVTKNPDGTWTSEAKNLSISSFAYLSLSQKDWGGNTGTANASFIVQTDKAAFVRVSTDLSDGAYTVGEVINLYLEFTKPVSSSGTPSLTLNFGTNKTASYEPSSNNSKKHSFTYTVKAGDTVDKLNITSLSGIWTEGSETVVLDSGDIPINQNLGDFHAIEIDTTSPILEKFTTTNISASYSEGRQINIQAHFSEPVIVTGTPRLQLNTVDKAFAVYKNASDGGKILNFSYTVAEGKNTPAGGLKISSFNFGSSGDATVKDFAGNAFTSTAGGDLDKKIIIDTTAPTAPTIEDITSQTYYGKSPSFTLSGLEDGASAEYSIDNGSNWLPYASAVELPNGSYKVKARQRDEAGNVSSESGPITLSVDTAPLLEYISAITSDGIYGQDSTIDITLHFRKEITVTGTNSLVLNTAPSRSATYTRGSGTNTLVFSYKVQDGDSCKKLDVSALSFSGSFTIDGQEVKTFISLPTEDEKKLSGHRSIKIQTGQPELSSATLDGESLLLKFNREIYKGSGNITIAIDKDDYRIPTVLTQARYNYLKGKLATLSADKEAFKEAFIDSYELTTNGLKADGSPDLAPKYVLKFSINPENTATGDPTAPANLVAALKEADDDKIIISVASGDVSISDSLDTLKIKLEGANALPVKGVLYTVSIPEGLVQDSLSNKNPENTEKTFSLGGIEKPTIRIDRQKERLEVLEGTVRATQPYTAEVKISSRTPGVTYSYSTVQTWYAPKVPEVSNGTTNDSTTTTVDIPTAPSGTGSTFTIGSATQNTYGLVCNITAEVNNGSDKVSANDIAYRTVLRYSNGNDSSGGGNLFSNATDYKTGTKQVWVRGGDAPSGSTRTPGFPLAWDAEDYKNPKEGKYPTGARLLTRTGTNDVGYWTWVSWDITKTAYIRLLLGTTSADLADIEKKGPLYWGWSKNSFVRYTENYPIKPGHSRELRSNDGTNNEKFMFATDGDGGVFHR